MARPDGRWWANVRPVLLTLIVLMSVGCGRRDRIQSRQQKASVSFSPVGAWSFDEGSGTTVSDRSGNGHAGTLNGGAWTRTPTGAGLLLDGDQDFVTVPNAPALNITTAVTVAAWVKFATLDPAIRQKIFYKGYTNSVNYALGKSEYENRFEFVFTRPGAGDTFLRSNLLVETERWYHVAATYDGTTAKLYVDGRLDASGNFPGTLATTTEDLKLGQLNWGTTSTA